VRTSGFAIGNTGNGELVWGYSDHETVKGEWDDV